LATSIAALFTIPAVISLGMHLLGV
jgi:hypothetical protein